MGSDTGHRYIVDVAKIYALTNVGAVGACVGLRVGVHVGEVVGGQPSMSGALAITSAFVTGVGPRSYARTSVIILLFVYMCMCMCLRVCVHKRE